MCSYVYRITCTHPDSPEQYYYGHRTCPPNVTPDQDLYWSSSKYVHKAMDFYGREFFTKKIVRTFEDRESAIALEIRLHERLRVDLHPKFFNRAKASKFGFRCTGAMMKGKTYEEIHGEEKAATLREGKRKILRGKNHKGAANPMFGRKQAQHVKDAVSKANSGENSAFYGMKWYTNGVDNVRCFPGDEPSGYRQGRRYARRVPNVSVSSV